MSRKPWQSGALEISDLGFYRLKKASYSDYPLIPSHFDCSMFG